MSVFQGATTPIHVSDSDVVDFFPGWTICEPSSKYPWCVAIKTPAGFSSSTKVLLVRREGRFVIFAYAASSNVVASLKYKADKPFLDYAQEIIKLIDSTMPLDSGCKLRFLIGEDVVMPEQFRKPAKHWFKRAANEQSSVQAKTPDDHVRSQEVRSRKADSKTAKKRPAAGASSSNRPLKRPAKK